MALGDTLAGRLIDGRYRVVHRIARGGMANVYAARDERLDRDVALKVMHEGLVGDRLFVDRFHREARSAAQLSSPYVVSVYDQGAVDGIVYLVMELVSGRTLRDVMRDEAPMSPIRAFELVDEVLIALQAAHEAGIVHRDVKPENVLVPDVGHLKVADFGLARAVSSATASTSATMTGTLIGTVSYLAPELVVGEPAGPRSDVYAVGCVMYEMLTGLKPHTGESPIQIAYKHVHEDVAAPSLTTRSLPPYVDALVARATVRDPALRAADAGVLRRQVGHVLHALRSGLADDPTLTSDLLPPDRRPVDADGPTAVSPLPDADDVAATAADPDPFAPAMPLTLFAGGADERPAERSAWVSAASGATAPVGERPGWSPDQHHATPHRPDEPWIRPGLEPDPALERRRRRRSVAMLVVVALMAGAAAVGGWWYGAGRYDSTPSLTGKSESQAREIVEQAGLSLDVSSERYDETVPEGSVITSAPEPGDRILEGGTVEVTISLGKERYPVPEIRGMTLDDAERELVDAGLALGAVTRTFSEAIRRGDVMAPRTEPGTMLKPGEEVDVWVSRGREPIPIESFVGYGVDVATAELNDLGFAVEVDEVYDAEAVENLVIAQDPEDGRGFADDTITLTVSLGPEPIVMPDLVGDDLRDARRELKELGLRVKVERSGLSLLGLGRVVGQDPEDGTEVEPRTRVTLRVV